MLLFDHPTPLFFVLLFALSVFVEIGHRAGMRLSVDTDSLRHEQLVAARDAIGLLLILLLGFTLARAIARLTSASDFSSTRRTPSARLRGALVRFPNRSTQKCSDCLANMLTRVRASLLRAWRARLGAVHHHSETSSGPAVGSSRSRGKNRTNRDHLSFYLVA